MIKFIHGLLLFICAFSVLANERLVVAGGSLTELIFSLGAGDRIAGVDQTTSFPPATATLPHIGYWKQLSSESILSLRPDSLITWQDAGPAIALDQLRSQGVNVITLPRIPATVEQMYTNIRTLAMALDTSAQGEALITALRQRLNQVQHSVAAQKQPVTALFILSMGSGTPQVAGKGSVADAIMTLAGARNLAQHSQYRSYSVEALIAANPDVIIVTSQMVRGDINRLSAISGITRTSAWKNHRIVTIDQALILGMGPRVADATEMLHRQLWPQSGS